jgi:hypothetical protein
MAYILDGIFKSAKTFKNMRAAMNANATKKKKKKSGKESPPLHATEKNLDKTQTL